MAGKLRRALADTGILFALPISAALLPWRMGFAWLKFWSRRGWLWRAEIDAAWAAAQQSLDGLDETGFKNELRLLLLVDRCDSYLAFLRGSGWWIKHVDVHGKWPNDPRSNALLSFHWGAGHWVFRIFSAHGLAVHVITGRAKVADIGRGVLVRVYLAWRHWSLSRIGSFPPLVVGGSRARIIEALNRGDSVFGMLDVPASANQRAIEVGLLNRRMRLRTGLAELIVEADAPVLMFACGLDPQTGRRELHLESPPTDLSVDELLDHYSGFLARCIRARPAAWQAWPYADELWPLRSVEPGHDKP